MKRACHFQMEAEKKMNKHYEGHDKLQKHRTKGLHNKVDYLRNTYIHIYVNLQTPVRRPCDITVL